MELGDQLKKLRKEQAMSQEDLAKQLNVSRQAVYKWENNKGYPDIENLIELGDLFNVTVDEIIKSDDQLRNRINVDKEENTFSDPGFYLGTAIVFLGLFTDFGSVSTALLFIGLAITIFYGDILNVTRAVIKDLKRTIKG